MRNRFFFDESNIHKAEQIWAQIASRYKGRPEVAGYDLLNEPMGAPDQETLYDLVQDLLRNKTVSDPIYQRALAKFGEPGVVDTVGIVGYYSMLAMVLNTARTPGGESTAPVLQPLKK